MANSKRNLIIGIHIIVLAALILGILFYMIPYRYRLNTAVSFDADTTIVDNPLMGFAPRADDKEQAREADLVFIELTWAEWEPRRDQYAIDAIERKYNISEWKSQNKYAVLRFVCDVPGKPGHRDIPNWLYDATGDGTDYYLATGTGGYCPNYANDFLIERHTRAIRALQNYCNQDHFVAFVEMGSLGHDGLWQADDGKGSDLMPSSDVCMQYSDVYLENFVNAIILAPKNYDFAVNNGLGVFTDSLGDREAMSSFDKMLGEDGTQKTKRKALNLVKLDDYGLKTPIGSNLGRELTYDDLMNDENFGDTLEQISWSHISFIGPDTPDLTSEENRVKRDSILRRMGYRIYVSSLKTQYDFGNNVLQLTLDWRNSGATGFYFDWPVMIHVYDRSGKELYWETLNLDLRTLSADTPVQTVTNIAYNEDIRDEYYIGITISDYQEKSHVRLAVSSDSVPGHQWFGDSEIIYHFKRQ